MFGAGVLSKNGANKSAGFIVDVQVQHRLGSLTVGTLQALLNSQRAAQGVSPQEFTLCEKTDRESFEERKKRTFHPRDLSQAPTGVLGVSPTTTPRLTEAPVYGKGNKERNPYAPTAK